jgi:hypothetical protein
LNVELEAKENVEAGEVVDVKLKLQEWVEGFQWTLETEGLRYESVSSQTIGISDQNVGVLKDGIITMSWNTEGNESAEVGQVVQIRFTALESGNLADMLHLSSLITDAEAYTVTGEILDVKLGYTETTPEFALYQNKPNPWNAQTTIGFDLPADASVKFTIFDMAGKAVKTVEGEYKKGYNAITLSVLDLPSTGVMYYRLESGEYSASKKMVLIK